MAPNSNTNDNLMFLFICLLNLKDSTIDFNLVSAATNLTREAARMRWVRLKKQLEGDLVDGKFDLTKGNANSSGAIKAAAAPVALAAPTKAPAFSVAAPSTTVSAAKRKRGVKRKKIAAEDDDAE